MATMGKHNSITDVFGIMAGHYTDKVAAIATEKGGRTSHAAILARSLAIPCVTGVEDLLDAVNTGKIVLVDGDAGTVETDVSAERLEEARLEAGRGDVLENDAVLLNEGHLADLLGQRHPSEQVLDTIGYRYVRLAIRSIRRLRRPQRRRRLRRNDVDVALPDPEKGEAAEHARVLIRSIGRVEIGPDDLEIPVRLRGAVEMPLESD